MGMAMHFHGGDAELLHLGERVAEWARERKLTAKEVALAARLDLRTARSVLEGSCGVRAFDGLARAYGWDFLEHVMTPAVGADPITAREREIEHEKREIAAREARLDRLRQARGASDRSGLRMVP